MLWEFSYKETWLHKINPSFKLVLVFLLCIQVLFIHNLNFIINYMLAVLVLYLCFTGHPCKRLLLISVPFIILFLTSSTSMIFFGKGEETWFEWGLVHITEESFFRGLHIGVRGLIFAVLGVVFALTTRPVYLFYSLMQQLKLRPKYAYSFMAAVQLIPIMVEEMQNRRHALKVRGLQYGTGFGGFIEKFRLYSIPLLSQSIRRAHRLAVAMEAKSFQGSANRTFYYKMGFSWLDTIFLLYFIIFISASYLLAIYFPYFPAADVRFN
ncbi:energy-coupling factor transporter transmembrane protein EcfT [Sediminibacillus dalangtanensis]|uniref:Energy-coupling factor transporter transmembrane protein EcfT n=1 Tax=Sediminibacillus dalangtanensis TaxID=2729421 RepID=A0ABX7VX97_9BACI|nr:energy-coupling factor transporter transmembrane component T [Sediminibacillus dalangtanensis]QTN00645.1 energy-coupling factor transporter transmembrane protein EcfT [Sediminibacillus dalangtanensis]